MGSDAGTILKVAAPVALSFALPGIGTELGLTAAETGALGAAAGAGVGAATGGVKGAVIGGIGTGIGSYVNASGGFGNALNNITGSASAASPGNIVWDTPASASDVNLASPAAAADGLTVNGAAQGGYTLPGVSGFGAALSSTATPVTSSGISSFIPSAIGGTGANPSPLTLAGLGANLYSGIQGSAAAKANTEAMQEANNNALALQAKNYDATTANLKPFLTTGAAANQQLQTDLGIGGNPNDPNYGKLTAPFTAADLENTPGYQFQLQQGTQALNRSLGAQGMQFSGAALKEAQQFGQGLADTTYNDAYSHYLAGNQQNFNMLNSASQSGQNAAVNQGSFGAGNSGLGTETLGNTGNITAAGNNAGNTAVNNTIAGALSGTYGFGSGSGAGASSYGGNASTGSSYGTPTGIAGALASTSGAANGGYTVDAQGNVYLNGVKVQQNNGGQ